MTQFSTFTRLRALWCLTTGLTLSSLVAAQASTAPAAATQTTVGAESNDDGPSVTARPEPGELSRGWLNQQASKAQASKIRQTQSGEVSGLIYNRYVKSYEKPRDLSTSSATRPF